MNTTPALSRQAHQLLAGSGAWITSGARKRGEKYTVAPSSPVPSRFPSLTGYTTAMRHGCTPEEARLYSDYAFTANTRVSIEASFYDFVGVTGGAGACIPNTIAPCFSSTRGLIHGSIDVSKHKRAADARAYAKNGYQRKPRTILNSDGAQQHVGSDVYTYLSADHKRQLWQESGGQRGDYREMTVDERTTGHADCIAPLYGKYPDGTYFIVKAGNRPEVVAAALTMFDWQNTPEPKKTRGKRSPEAKARQAAKTIAKRRAKYAA